MHPLHKRPRRAALALAVSALLATGPAHAAAQRLQNEPGLPVVLSGHLNVQAQVGAACGAEPLPQRVPVQMWVRAGDAATPIQGLVWGDMVPTAVQGDHPGQLALRWLGPGVASPWRHGHQAQLRWDGQRWRGVWQERAPAEVAATAHACFWTQADIELEPLSGPPSAALAQQAQALWELLQRSEAVAAASQAAALSELHSLARLASAAPWGSPGPAGQGTAAAAPASAGDLIRQAAQVLLELAEQQLAHTAAAAAIAAPAAPPRPGPPGLDRDAARDPARDAAREAARQAARERASALLLPLAQASSAWPVDSPPSAVATAELAGRLGVLLRASGQPEAALAVFSRGLKALADQGLPEHEQAAVLMSSYGSLLIRQQRLPEAVAVFERALQVEQSHAPAHAPAVVVATLNAARALQRNGQPGRATQLLHERLQALQAPGLDAAATAPWREAVQRALDGIRTHRGASQFRATRHEVAAIAPAHFRALAPVAFIRPPTGE
jgi:hypothetical protein